MQCNALACFLQTVQLSIPGQLKAMSAVRWNQEAIKSWLLGFLSQSVRLLVLKWKIKFLCFWSSQSGWNTQHIPSDLWFNTLILLRNLRKLQMWRDRVSSLSSTSPQFPRNLEILFVALLEIFVASQIKKDYLICFAAMEDSKEFQKDTNTQRQRHNGSSICLANWKRFPGNQNLPTPLRTKTEMTLLRIKTTTWQI